MERYIRELEDLKRLRQKERDTFFSKIDNEIQKNQGQRDRMKMNNRDHQDYIKQQIVVRHEVKSENQLREKQYAKPHFGPEETPELIAYDRRMLRRKKELIKRYLQMQMDDKRERSEISKRMERKLENQRIMTERATERLQDIVELQKKQLLA